MRALVTGGTGVVGTAVVRALHERGHQVRVLTRHAGRDQPWWPVGVDGWAGDVSNERSIRGAADGCDVVVHLAGIVTEHPPTSTFQSVNIEGTRYTVLEAERSDVRKLVYVSSLGADRGRSAYHRSKLVGEDILKTFTRDWVVLRPGAVYGPGDEHLSVLLQMVRTLPVIPTIGDGNQRFQPIWHVDFAAAVVASVERPDVRCEIYEVAGTELTSQNDLVERMRAITGRSAVQAPLPEVVASWGLKMLDAAGVDVPFTEAQLEMLTEGNTIPAGHVNALTEVFGIAPTSLDAGLRHLANEQPAQLPADGVGALERKRFWVHVRGGTFDAERLFAYVRDHLSELMPALVRMHVEPTAGTRIEAGETLTLEIPLRGHIQVRVAEAAEGRITLLTVAGHPIAGAVRFLTVQEGDAVRFEIQVYDRAASLLDEIMLRTAGSWLQRQAWIGLAKNVARAAGSEDPEIASTTEVLSGHELEVVNDWAKTLDAQLSRNSASGGRS
jgi:NADH dehydrogenase